MRKKSSLLGFKAPAEANARLTQICDVASSARVSVTDDTAADSGKTGTPFPTRRKQGF